MNSISNMQPEPATSNIQSISNRDEFDRVVEQERSEGEVVVLESQLASHPSSTESWIFAGFDAIFRWHQHDGDAETAGDPWVALQRFRERFPGYTCGFLGYDLKNAREQLQSSNTDPVGLPDIWMGRPSRIYRYRLPDNPAQRNAQINTTEAVRGAVSISSIFHSRTPKQVYLSKVRRAQDYIKEGDIYEINLSHQLSADFDSDSLELYRSMRNGGAVPFAAYLYIDGVQACCASPERYLTKKGNSVLSEPIKGTRPRGITPDEDNQIRQELGTSVKDHAENLMIVDLVRNDLSRVCKPGSVRADKLFEIQEFGTVFQLVSSVSGELREEIPSVEALAACFPMGSMTGAPKIRSMELIEELEDYRRGLYSGAIGFLTPDDDFSFNVVIRTAIIRDSKLYYAVGGAITSDSNPEAEWQETLVKARALSTHLTGNSLDLSE